MANDSTKSDPEITESAPPEAAIEAVGKTDSPAPETNEAVKEEAVRKTDKPPFDVKGELESLEKQLATLDHKHSVALVTFENNLNRARKFIQEEEESLASLADSMRSKLQEFFDKNQAHQESLQGKVGELISKLETALEDGKSHDALSTWDKIQSNFNNTTGEIKLSIQPLLTPFKAKITELRDWKIFAATEKKKELIEQMTHLSESRMNPADRNKHISKLHRDWKTLGRSNQNEELWLQFKQASDKASEPCKEYFKQRKQQLAENFKAREALCNELEEKLASLAEDALNLGQINKLLKHADESWKRHAPVDHNKIKTLQKRYYDSVNLLRKKRKNLVKSSANTKKELISRAKTLLDSEDKKKAMEEAKQLQKEWKLAGPGAYKDDKQLWENFRSLCDQIFAVKDEQKQAQKSKLDESRKQLQSILRDIESLLTVSDEELREKRKQYQSLQQSFSSTLEQLPGKQRTRFREQFSGFKRNLDTRIKSLPDKKTQELLEKIAACANYLQSIEVSLMQKGADIDKENPGEFDSAHWRELIAGINSDHQPRLQQRAEFLLNPTQQSEAVNAAQDAFRQLCIKAEIKANIESPQEDQAARMELQLTQLKQGFGRGQGQQEKLGDFIINCRLEALCLGPLQEDERQQFQMRLDNSLQRLF